MRPAGGADLRRYLSLPSCPPRCTPHTTFPRYKPDRNEKSSQGQWYRAGEVAKVCRESQGQRNASIKRQQRWGGGARWLQGIARCRRGAVVAPAQFEKDLLVVHEARVPRGVGRLCCQSPYLKPRPHPSQCSCQYFPSIRERLDEKHMSGFRWTEKGEIPSSLWTCALASPYPRLRSAHAPCSLLVRRPLKQHER
jgi:hypothetical protein